ncbi:uncharacterized protein LOC127789122 [Diospyros lotus]|uniref:uncharacterized protein LOC127789122 n=1 Tax=Diospyros lotus TaxID=55363 RepID=UPI002251E707|nr:uncharacterized protein LOC127789122 [Diospyros lotus]
MMAQSLTASAAAAPPISTAPPPPSTKKIKGAAHFRPSPPLLHRRSIAWGLAGAVLGLNSVVNGGEERASAAGRRPPPPPAEEKKDLSLSALQAKVLASKKRKEALKEEVAKLRERGKPVTVNE